MLLVTDVFVGWEEGTSEPGPVTVGGWVVEATGGAPEEVTGGAISGK